MIILSLFFPLSKFAVCGILVRFENTGEVVRYLPGEVMWTHGQWALSQTKDGKFILLHHGGIRFRNLFNQFLAENNYRIIWDGNSNSGKRVSAGIYYAILEFEDQKVANSVIFIP